MVCHTDLFIPLEDTRLQSKEGARIARLTDLQWEFFFTCWRYNIDFFFGLRERHTHWKFNLGVPLYYYGLGRKLFCPSMKYPLLRLGHFPERFLRKQAMSGLLSWEDITFYRAGSGGSARGTPTT
jgi:hypothetical protein